MGKKAAVVAAAPAAADAAAAPAEEETGDASEEKRRQKTEKTESAGISKAERDELEKLKNDIIARKKELKEGGMSGGQMNKDEQVVAWVNRMNELKEKECPGSTAKGGAGGDEKKSGKKKALSAEAEAQLENLEREIEEYKMKLTTEFKYSKKEIAADPDMVDMLARLKAVKGGK